MVGGGARVGEVMASDIEQHPYLKEQESLWCARALAASEAEVAKRKEEKAELEEAVKELSSTIQVRRRDACAPASHL